MRSAKNKNAAAPLSLENATDIVGTAFASAYSRENEDQADRVGLFYMVEAGYDPREAPKVWSRLMEFNLKSRAQKTANSLDKATNVINNLGISAENMDDDKALADAAIRMSVMGGQLMNKAAQMLYATHPRFQKALQEPQPFS